jgi:hypothetical protein
MLISFIKPTKKMRRVTQFVMSSRSAIKKRKMIREISDLYGISIPVINDCDCPLNVLSLVILLLRKLLIH